MAIFFSTVSIYIEKTCHCKYCTHLFHIVSFKQLENIRHVTHIHTIFFYFFVLFHALFVFFFFSVLFFSFLFFFSWRINEIEILQQFPWNTSWKHKEMETNANGTELPSLSKSGSSHRLFQCRGNGSSFLRQFIGRTRS